jgi:hypothetical protein
MKSLLYVILVSFCCFGCEDSSGDGRYERVSFNIEDFRESLNKSIKDEKWRFVQRRDGNFRNRGSIYISQFSKGRESVLISFRINNEKSEFFDLTFFCDDKGITAPETASLLKRLREEVPQIMSSAKFSTLFEAVEDHHELQEDNKS